MKHYHILQFETSYWQQIRLSQVNEVINVLCGGIGRHVRFRSSCESVGVPNLLAPTQNKNMLTQ